MIDAFRWAVLLLFLVAGMYFGVGGWVVFSVEITIDAAIGSESGDSKGYVYEGVEYRDKQQLMAFLAETRGTRFFPWIMKLPTVASLAVAACAFGALGGVVRVLREIVLDTKTIRQVPVAAVPLLGVTMSFMVLGLSVLIPATLTVGESAEVNPRPVAIMFFSFFAAAFCDHAYTWVESIMDRLFPK